MLRVSRKKAPLPIKGKNSIHLAQKRIPMALALSTLAGCGGCSTADKFEITGRDANCSTVTIEARDEDGVISHTSGIYVGYDKKREVYVVLTNKLLPEISKKIISGPITAGEPIVNMDVPYDENPNRRLEIIGENVTARYLRDDDGSIIGSDAPNVIMLGLHADEKEGQKNPFSPSIPSCFRPLRVANPKENEPVLATSIQYFLRPATIDHVNAHASVGNAKTNVAQGEHVLVASPFVKQGIGVEITNVGIYNANGELVGYFDPKATDLINAVTLPVDPQAKLMDNYFPSQKSGGDSNTIALTPGKNLQDLIDYTMGRMKDPEKLKGIKKIIVDFNQGLKLKNESSRERKT